MGLGSARITTGRDDREHDSYSSAQLVAPRGAAGELGDWFTITSTPGPYQTVR